MRGDVPICCQCLRTFAKHSFLVMLLDLRNNYLEESIFHLYGSLSQGLQIVSKLFSCKHLCFDASPYQVGAKMSKSTRPVYWGRKVITGCTVVEDMLEWALWVTPTAPYTVSG